LKTLLWILLAISAAAIGCRSARDDVRAQQIIAKPTIAKTEPLAIDSLTSDAKTQAEATALDLQATFLEDLNATVQSPVVQASQTTELPMPSELLLNPAEVEIDSAAIPEVAIPEILPPPDAPISLDDVITAVFASYPSLDAAAREQQITAGKQLSASGEFDQMLFGDIMTEPLGYYENYRYRLGVKQYQWNGTQTFAEYRLGRGSFEPWYLERQTNAGGEFKVGVAVPFVRDRDIDKRRAAVLLAQLDNASAEPIFQLEVIDSVRAASIAYWEWVAAGQRVKISKQNLDLAVERQAGIEQRVAKGEIAAIDIVDNERLIVSRQAKLIESERKLQQAVIKLSLYLRDPRGIPLLASQEQMPSGFPVEEELAQDIEEEQIAIALSSRPELILIGLEQEKQRVEVEQASNLTLPSMTGLFTASQDVGAPTSFKRDKSPAELEAGVLLDVPLQRSEAMGKLQTARGKLAQLAAKRQLLEQTIVAQVQNYRTALDANLAALKQAKRGAQLADEMADAERKRLARGDSDILTVNLREIAAFDAELLAIDAAAEYFMAIALLNAAMGNELTYRAIMLGIPD
jgi:outer membrane protein TolC